MKATNLFFALTAGAILTLASCKKKEIPEPKLPVIPGPTLNVDDDEQMIGEVGGESFKYQDVSSNASAYPAEYTVQTNETGNLVSVGAMLTDWETEDTLAGYLLGNIQLDQDGLADAGAYDNLFKADAEYSFATNGNDGVTIFWSDDNGKLYRSDWGSGDQTGSAFKIVDSEDDTWLGDPSMKVHAEFNCKVYDASGNSKTITDGEFVFETVTWTK